MNRDEGGLQRNVLGGPLGVCSEQPVTGFQSCLQSGAVFINLHDGHIFPHFFHLCAYAAIATF